MEAVRNQVIALLEGGQAFGTFNEIAGEFAPEKRGVIPPGAEHSAWQIVEHMRIALRDILDYSQNENGTYEEKEWPDEYWPPSPLPSANAWDESVDGYRNDLARLRAIVADESRDLLRPFPWAEQHTLLREALVAAEHAAYHLGELVELQRWLVSANGP
ncbi:MAG TPA: DinB family protein [Fimbriimonadaceae bacterium]|nr:DinB family protein [Fimbriimonadaceae bacterium]